jgi:hypothetical protein
MIRVMTLTHPTVGTIFDAIVSGAGELVAGPPEGCGPGYWVGAPSVVLDRGTTWLAYRIRRPLDRGRGLANVVARSADGLRFDTVATLRSEDFAAASLERPSLVRVPEGVRRRPDGAWRLYVSCSTPGSKHWRVEALDAPTPEDLPRARRTVVLAGGDLEGWKDPVVWHDGERWQMWACRHPLDAGDDEADRMSSHHAVSADGLVWDWTGRSLMPTPGTWDARGTRVTAAYEEAVFYDGRASAAENWRERTGVAAGDPLHPVLGPCPAGAALRYVCVVDEKKGVRAYWEAERADGAHELRMRFIPGHVSPRARQSHGASHPGRIISTAHHF